MNLSLSDLFGRNTTTIGSNIGVSNQGKSLNLGTFNPYNSWEDYYERGIIPNLWKGITGQTSADRNTDKSITLAENQYKDELAQQKDLFLTNLQANSDMFHSELEWQKNQFGQQLDFANRNLDENVRATNLNYGLQKEAYEYQKQLNATQMEREDTAIQRQMKDLQSAGLSPLAAIGGNGASSSSLSAGSPAQYDMTGINQNAGIYSDFARQYASLHQKATEGFMSNRQNAYGQYSSARAAIARQHNSEVLGARMALTQMKSDMHYKGQNMATQYFNAAVNYRDSLLNREYMREQISNLRDEHAFNKKYGYRGQNATQVLTNAIVSYLDYKKSKDDEPLLTTAFNVGKEKAVQLEKTIVENVKSIPEHLQEKINNSDLEGWQKIALSAYTSYLFHPIESIKNDSIALWETGKSLYQKYLKKGK